MANVVFNRGKYLLSTAGLNLASADLRVLLVTTGYTPAATHNVVSDVVTYELTVGGYARQTLANKAVTEDDSNGYAYLDADDVVFTSLLAGETIGGAVIFKHTGSDATAELLAFIDLTDTATNGENVTVRWPAPASGAILKLA